MFKRSGKFFQPSPSLSSEVIKKLPESVKEEMVAESISSVSTGAVEKKSWEDKIKGSKEPSGQGNFLKSAQLLKR